MTYEKPEISETPYNRHIPAEPAQPSRTERTALRLKDMWDNRPSFWEMHSEVLMRAVMYSSFVAIGVGVADDALDIHIADRMAEVRVNPNQNFVVQEAQWLVSEVGKMAQDVERH